MPLNSLPFVIPNRFSGEESALPQPGCPGLAIFETWETKSSGALARRFDVGSLACMFRKIRVRVRLQAYRKDLPYRSRPRRSPLGVSTTGDVHPSRDPSLRDVILALSRAKGKDLCIRAQRSQWQRTRLEIRLQPCRKPGNPTIASTHPSHLSLPPDVILSADGSMHPRSTAP